MFLFDFNSSLKRKQATVHNINNKYDDHRHEFNDDYVQLMNFKFNFTKNNKQRKFILHPRYLVCALRYYRSDDPKKFLRQEDAFLPDWMSIKIRKHNADRRSSPKIELTFLLPPPIEVTITKIICNEKKQTCHSMKIILLIIVLMSAIAQILILIMHPL